MRFFQSEKEQVRKKLQAMTQAERLEYRKRLGHGGPDWTAEQDLKIYEEHLNLRPKILDLLKIPTVEQRTLAWTRYATLFAFLGLALPFLLRLCGCQP